MVYTGTSLVAPARVIASWDVPGVTHADLAARSAKFAEQNHVHLLAPELLKLKQTGVPVVVAPQWAEPLLRQAAPPAFPAAELTRPDSSAFAAFLEVSLLGQSAPELAGFNVERSLDVGKFRLSWKRNPRPQPVLFDFVPGPDPPPCRSGGSHVATSCVGHRNPGAWDRDAPWRTRPRRRAARPAGGARDVHRTFTARRNTSPRQRVAYS